mgnify:CR=1 FL=1|tara:strand:- start:486 stop:719 length:234 start_codon:yes stop_codon:yes gene_type:complete
MNFHRTFRVQTGDKMVLEIQEMSARLADFIYAYVISGDDDKLDEMCEIISTHISKDGSEELEEFINREEEKMIGEAE